MSQDEKKSPSSLTFDQICESQEFEHVQEFVLKENYDALAAELAVCKAVFKDHEDDWRRIQDVERKCEAMAAEISEKISLIKDKNSELKTLCHEMRSALESARGWVSTHAMQTYSRVADKEVGEIDTLIKKAKEILDGE